MTTADTDTAPDADVSARAELRAAGERLRAARAEEAAARAAMDELVVSALRAGVPQQDVVALSGLARETVRTIARDGGIQPPPGWQNRPKRGRKVSR